MALPLAILIFFFVLLLLFGANMVVTALRHFSSSKTSTFTLSAILLALATSFPELFIAITSGLEGTSELALGNFLGANITNLTLVAGGAAVIAGRVAMHGEFLRREAWIALIAGVVPLVLLLDGILSRIDGMILIAVWGAYVVHFFHIRFIQIAQKLSDEGFWYRFLHKVEVGVNGTKGRETARLLLGVALLLFSADVIVRISSSLAHDIGIPIFLVGVLVIALGTTLPELALSFRSIADGEPQMFIGNILGSLITNATLVVGVASILSPIKVDPVPALTVGAAFVTIYALFWIFIETKQRLDRLEAGILVALYILFVIIIR